MKLAGCLIFSAFCLLVPRVFAQDSDQSSSDSGALVSSPTDEIIVKSTHAVMSQITANMKLTQDQMSAIQPIITDNIVKVRDLQLSLEKGAIDSKTMYNQRELLTEGENQALSRILTSDQMRVWMNMQNQ